MLLQTRLTIFLPWNKKVDILHSMQVNLSMLIFLMIDVYLN